MTDPTPVKWDSADQLLSQAVAAFQAELPRVRKGSTAVVTSEKAKYKYTYADLAELSPLVLPLLAKNDLCWVTRPTLTEDGRFVLEYSLLHAAGGSITGRYPLPDPRSSPQILGSAITYARRYALLAVTGVAPDDDDDDAAAATKAPPPETQPTSVPAASSRAAQLRERIREIGHSKHLTDVEIAEMFERVTTIKIMVASVTALSRFADQFEKWTPGETDADN